MENIKGVPSVIAGEKKFLKNRDWCHKVLISVLIAAGSAAIMFAFYLLVNGRAQIEGVTTIVVVTVFALMFSISLLDRLGI